ncbi:2OG-Fe dioxygenase family protein [Paracraurococcus lichenis]|uniref:2OG-Fe dioxygenase family protein n=1 Tax=Paracraurococcus lichenis TaxID=3064888 RepID=A0ABT9DZ82_9PROT|nr:2OG-Fe dioxygenase family protein [Paracraurococcus sp. LOR1-02]MDO9709199.1 2OG-Fe dioxygenase family protein [Paracraurococcus sp. LOR1-02]
MSAALETAAADPLLEQVSAQGFALLRSAEMTARLGLAPAALDGFAASWERLEVDKFMADGGRYRRRRHANFTARAGIPGHLRGPHRPHFQAVVHNSLNGGVERWFGPMEDAVADSAPMQALLDLGRGVADARSPGADWFVEVHQFRIEAAAGAPGFPTPEGVHHDGVDYVLIGMMARTNLLGGETLITDDEDRELARFTLLDRLDTAFVDDIRVKHGVTPVGPADPALPSCRDVLVITWKRGGPPG